MRWRIKYTYDLQRRYWKLLEETADRPQKTNKNDDRKQEYLKEHRNSQPFEAVHIKWNKCWWFVRSAVGGVPPHDQGSSHDVFYVDGVDDDDHCNRIRNLTELNMSTNEFFFVCKCSIDIAFMPIFGRRVTRHVHTTNHNLIWNPDIRSYSYTAYSKEHVA